MVLSLVIGILQLIVGDRFVIIERIHVKNLDLVDAYTHPSDSIGIRDSLTVIIQNSSGTYTLSGK